MNTSTQAPKNNIQIARDQMLAIRIAELLSIAKGEKK